VTDTAAEEVGCEGGLGGVRRRQLTPNQLTFQSAVAAVISRRRENIAIVASDQRIISYFISLAYWLLLGEAS
jgi:hypothetical protein